LNPAGAPLISQKICSDKRSQLYVYEALTGRSLHLCPVCHTGHMERIGIVPATVGRARALRVDTS